MSVERICFQCGVKYDVRHDDCPACAQAEIAALRNQVATLRTENARLLECIPPPSPPLAQGKTLEIE